MPVLFQKWIERDDLKKNPNVLYLFGDNLVRKGLGGQAKAMRGEPNAVGIATKRAPGMRPEDFFYDADFDEIVEELDLDFAPAKLHVALGGILIIPTDGLGTGLSKLPEHAPNVLAYIDAQIALLCDMATQSDCM